MTMTMTMTMMMTTDTHTEYMIQLGIFDDQDVLPTVVFGVIYPYENCDLIALASEMVAELLKAARKEYGRAIPKHAAFWQGSTQEVPNNNGGSDETLR
jgi:hypothetical protein